MSAGTSSYRIAVDCMGGDKGPAEVVFAAALALEEIGTSDKLILVGNERDIRKYAKRAGIFGHSQVEIRHAEEVIHMDDKPMQAIKSKKDSSMIRALEMVKAGEADAMVSTGNTKVLVGAGTLKLRPMPGADRPALAAIMPRHHGHFIFMDVGANPESTPDHLMHNAVLGTVYAQSALGIERPRVGLLTVGTEEGKGGEKINRTHALLKKLGDKINYIGPVEGFDMFQGDADVIISDGFTGNILLKAVEGMFHMFFDLIKEKTGKNLLYSSGGLLLLPIIVAIIFGNGWHIFYYLVGLCLIPALILPVLRQVKNELKPDRYGGAPLIGLNALVIKAHGSGNRHAICSAIRIGREALIHDMLERSKDALEVANKLVEETAPEAQA